MALNNLPPMPIWQRVQIEIGGRWQLFPSGSMTWREWLWSLYVNAAWPGRRIAFTAVPREFWEPGFIGNYANGKADARFYWASAAMRVLGLDLGVAIFYRPNPVPDPPRADIAVSEDDTPAQSPAGGEG